MKSAKIEKGKYIMKKLLIGNAAVARGAYEAGVNVVASYPGTPSTEITEEIVKFEEVYAEWSPNEKVAAEVAIGASIGGARAMSCMKHVGLNVMADPVFTVSYTGVGGGLVFCVADDPGMHSSQNEQDSRHYAEASKIMMLEPADSAECKEFTKKAFSLSEEFDTPAFIRLSTRVSHSQSLVELEERENIELKPYEKNIGKYVMMPANAIKRHVVVEERISALRAFAETSELNSVEENGSKIGVITAGIAYMYAKEALGDNYGATKLPTININGEDKQLSNFADFKLIGVNALTKAPIPAMQLAEYLGGEECQKLRFEARSIAPTNLKLSVDADVLANPAVAALSYQSSFSTLQSSIPQMGKYWTPAEAFGTELINKTVTTDNLQEKLDEMVNSILSTIG